MPRLLDIIGAHTNRTVGLLVILLADTAVSVVWLVDAEAVSVGLATLRAVADLGLNLKSKNKNKKPVQVCVYTQQSVELESPEQPPPDGSRPQYLQNIQL